jgi:hypothetical protein
MTKRSITFQRRYRPVPSWPRASGMEGIAANTVAASGPVPPQVYPGRLFVLVGSLSILAPPND